MNCQLFMNYLNCEVFLYEIIYCDLLLMFENQSRTMYLIMKYKMRLKIDLMLKKLFGRI